MVDRLLAGLPHRGVVLIGAVAIVVVGGTIAALAITGGSESGEPAAPPSLQSDAAPAPVAPAKAESPKQNSGQRGDARRSGRDGRGGDASDEKEPAAAAPSADDEQAAKCPLGLSRAQCKALSTSLAPGVRVKPGECPPAWSNELCRAAAQSLEDSEDGTSPLKPGECPPGWSQGRCDAIADALSPSLR